jgi:hypothetical protein
MRPRARQKGIAVLLVVALLVLGGTLLTLTALNASTWRADRYRVAHEALLLAKEALIARAVADDNRPGSLPCPDTDDDGDAELFAGTACPAYLGRLPWRTLGLPDLRDGSGERLWYALSATHRDEASAQPINSNTVGEITLAGIQPASNALAVVFAPGSALVRSGAATVQARGDPSLVCTTTPHQLTPKCNPFNYLDVLGAEDNADRDTAGNASFVAAVESTQFNDRALAILADDVMPLVERRIGRELAGLLRGHYDAWQSATGAGFYPWPAPFVDPSTTPAGASGTAEGLLPSTSAPAVWATGSANLGCVGVGTNVMTCSGLVWPGIIDFLNISGTVNNVGAALYNAPSPSDVTVSGLVLLGTPTASWTVSRAAQRLTFSYDAPAVAIGIVTLTLRAPTTSGWSSTWLAANRWNEVAYYALSPHYAISGSQACGASCITVSNVSPGTNKQALVVTAGRALATQGGRPVADTAQYIEAGNNTPGDYAFERALRSTTFNDQVTVVRP